MYKKASLYFFAFSLFIISHLPAQITLSKEVLVANPLVYSQEPFYTYTLTFNTDDTYSFGFGYEGDTWLEYGTYTITADFIYLTFQRTENSKLAFNKTHDSILGNATIKILSTPHDLYYTYYLEFKTEKRKNIYGFDNECSCAPFTFYGFAVEEGSSRKIGDIPVITLAQKAGTTIGKVKIRDKPSKSAKAITYFEYFSDLGNSAFVPNQTSLTAIARTTTKEKIDKYEDYWYYVNVGAKNGVWMYGAFIKFE
jgi:hypothetical protein